MRAVALVNMCRVSKVRNPDAAEITLGSEADSNDRFWCRYNHAKIGLDDYTIGLALAVALTLGIMNGFHISYGAGCATT